MTSASEGWLLLSKDVLQSVRAATAITVVLACVQPECIQPQSTSTLMQPWQVWGSIPVAPLAGTPFNHYHHYLLLHSLGGHAFSEPSLQVGLHLMHLLQARLQVGVVLL